MVYCGGVYWLRLSALTARQVDQCLHQYLLSLPPMMGLGSKLVVCVWINLLDMIQMNVNNMYLIVFNTSPLASSMHQPTYDF